MGKHDNDYEELPKPKELFDIPITKDEDNKLDSMVLKSETKEEPIEELLVEPSATNNEVRHINPKINVDADSVVLNDNVLADDEFFDDFFEDD